MVNKFYFFKKLKILENVLQKSLQQSLENEKSEMAILFIFPCSSLWCTLFFCRSIFHGENRETKSAVLTANSSFYIFSKNWKFLKMFCKNLCDKVSKIKNWRCTFYSFFHALRRGVLCFFCWCIFHGENCKTKLPVLTFLKKLEKAKSTGRNGGGNRKKNFPHHIHLRMLSEPVVLDPQTFSG